MAQSSAKKMKPAHKYFGQLLIGPPGAGKTTYCLKMSQFLKKLGRDVKIINLDPANEFIAYEPSIDIKNLIKLEDVMLQSKLGPNGALIYCMEYLEVNLDWLTQQMSWDNGTNVLFDLPGQVELYCHHDSLNKILNILQEKLHLQLCVVHLVDSHHCSDAGKFISALTLSLSAMLRMGLPHLNVLTKVDLLEKHKEKLLFGLDFYTEVLDLNYLLESLDSNVFTAKYKKLNSALVSIIEDYSLVSFELLNVFDEKSLLKIKNLVDKANGYVFKTEEGRSINSMLACAMGVQETPSHDMASPDMEEYKKLQQIEAKLDKCLSRKDGKRNLLCMQLLHDYNDIKDATQVVIGAIANIEGTTVTDIHKQLGLDDACN